LENAALQLAFLILGNFTKIKEPYMIKQPLTGIWQFRQAGKLDWMKATVPSCVFTDLMEAGRIPDPFDGENEKQVKWVAEQDWEYQRAFNVDAGLLAAERVELVCDRLDTLAELTLNGHLLGHTNNLFRQYRWDVKALLKPDNNLLTIVFRSPLAYINRRQQERKLPTLMNGGMAHLRKVQSHFGWDWGPTLPGSGIGQEISLEGRSTARLSNVHVRQSHENETVKLCVTAVCEQWTLPAAEDLTLIVQLTGPDGEMINASAPVLNGQAALEMPVTDPKLWWPNGLGAQPLYRMEVGLCVGEQVLEQRAYQIGLRALELRQEADQWGQTFTFVVNGVPIFAKGAAWIPADSFVTRFSAERLEHLIQSAAAANMNMLRVWGGGYYESDLFYDLCDRYGILIWQDFTFACAPYPLDEPDFLENVRVEVIENIRRLRHHASLALWCGNNEIEMMWGMWKRNNSLTVAYKEFFHRQLPELTRTEDPDHAYWPSSPSSGKFMKDTNGDARGDTHLWQVWHGLEPFTFFRTRFTRFASEFGLEALPALETIAGFAKPEEYDLKSKVMLHHQRSVGGNDKMLYYLTGRFRVPKQFADLVYLTQIMQAECIRTAVEHWRRNRPRCSGALYWQFNDCWPVTSWASVDYAGRWKALHYAARRFYAPLALSLEDQGGQVAVYVANDLPTAWNGSIRWSLETLSGEVIQAAQNLVTAEPLVATHSRTFDFSAQLAKHGADKLVFVAELWGQERITTQVVTFAPEKEMVLPNPELAVRPLTAHNGELSITVEAKKLARFVSLSLNAADVIFSDNFFDIPAGRSVTITCPLPAGWTLDQARQALKLRSLADVEPGGSALSDRLLHYRIGLLPNSLITRLLFKLM
jgi:beta-mannosidase